MCNSIILSKNLDSLYIHDKDVSSPYNNPRKDNTAVRFPKIRFLAWLNRWQKSNRDYIPTFFKMIDKGILSTEREREGERPLSKVGWIRSNVPIFLPTLFGKKRLAFRVIRDDDRGATTPRGRRYLGATIVQWISAVPVSRRGSRKNKDGESLRQKRRRWERPVFLRWSCAVSCKPPGKLDTVALALSQGSTRLWRTFDSMHHRHLEKSIEILPSWKKIGKQVHWGDLLSILSISFNFVFTERDSIDLNWKRFFVILFSNRERERDGSGIVSRSFIEFTYKRESLQARGWNISWAWRSFSTRVSFVPSTQAHYYSKCAAETIFARGSCRDVGSERVNKPRYQFNSKGNWNCEQWAVWRGALPPTVARVATATTNIGFLPRNERSNVGH